MALPPSGGTCAPASLASRWGVAMTPFVMPSRYRVPAPGPCQLTRGDELDRAWLDLEQRRQESDSLPVDVDAYLHRRRHRNALAVQQLDLGVGLIQVLAGTEIVHAAHRLDLAGVLDENHIEYAVGGRRGGRHLHSAAEKLVVGNDHLVSLWQLMRDVVDVHGHRLVLETDKCSQTAQRVGHAAEPLRPVAHLLYDLASKPGVGDVDEMAHRGRAVRRLVGDAT